MHNCINANNQAEQLAILKVLVTIESMNSHIIIPRTVTIYTDSRVSLDSLQNPNNDTHLVEEIKKKVTRMVRDKWKINSSSVKAHIGIFGNEMTDKLAKETARSKETNYVFRKIPISAIYREAAEEGILKWQEQWEKTSKAEATKQHFPTVMDRIRTKLNLTPKLTAVLSGQGKTNAYLHRFNLREDAMYICNIGDQTMDHILFQCVESRKQKELTKLQLRTKKKWPVNKLELITKHIQRIY